MGQWNPSGDSTAAKREREKWRVREEEEESGGGERILPNGSNDFSLFFFIFYFLFYFLDRELERVGVGK